jgi:hypothetical protein
MPKGNQKSNREAKKAPKPKVKAPPVPATPFAPWPTLKK